MVERSEKAVVNGALVAVSQLPETLAWRNNTGMAWQGIKIPVRVGQTVVIRSGMMILSEARPITFGLPGSGDLLGVTAGRGWALEGKALTGQQRDTQRKFQAAFERAGGLYGVFRSEEEALAILRGA